jgi:hypothetical protein
MTFITILLTLSLPLLLGLAILAALLRQQLDFFGFWEKGALAFAVGWGGHILLLFCLNLVKIPLAFNNVIGADLAALIILLPATYHSLFALTRIKLPRLTFNWVYLIGAVIGLKAVFTAWASFIKPAIDPDIIQCYALAAKMIYLNKFIPAASPIADKPLLPFLSQVWSVMGLQPWNDLLLTLPNPLMFVSLLIIFYAALVRYFPRWYALLFTLLLSTLPFLVFQVGKAYTDFPQAFYYSLATFYLCLFMKEFKRDKDPAAAYLLVSALLLGLSVWVKRSGLYYAGINLTTVAIFLFSSRQWIERRDWRTLARAALLFILIVAPWLAYNRFATVQDYSTQTVEALAESRTSLPILLAIGWNTFSEDNWHLLGLLFAAVLLLYRRRAFSSPLLLIIGLHLTAIFVLFRFTGLYRFIFDDTILNRLTCHFAPVILYFCAEVIGGEEQVGLAAQNKRPR